MTDADRPEFAKVLAALNIAYSKPASAARASIYFDDLKAAPVDLVARAAQYWRRTSNKYPKPSELRELCDKLSAEEFYARPRLAYSRPADQPDPEIGPTYHCLACQDMGWRWHLDGGPPFDRASAAHEAQRATPGSRLAVSKCPCRESNPVIQARQADAAAPRFFGGSGNGS